MKVNVTLLSQIIEPLLPVEPSLAPESRKEVAESVVLFVSQQILGMPAYLRVPYLLFMKIFNWLSLRPYGRLFANLDPVKQKDYVSAWIHSSLGPKKDFIKLIRSCALLRFYDHPKVRDALEGVQGK
ncbi:MAG: hypothetical protein KJ626_16145 [Verrucomicrobia bacterium]|nr:hypothetical protein [Verrucomicrobiota bacterium]